MRKYARNKNKDQALDSSASKEEDSTSKKMAKSLRFSAMVTSDKKEKEPEVTGSGSKRFGRSTYIGKSVKTEPKEEVKEENETKSSRYSRNKSKPEKKEEEKSDKKADTNESGNKSRGKYNRNNDNNASSSRHNTYNPKKDNSESNKKSGIQPKKLTFDRKGKVNNKKKEPGDFQFPEKDYGK